MFVTAGNIKSLVSYDPETGIMRRLSEQSKRTGTKDRYPRITIYGRVFAVHRLAWLYMTGEWPRHHIDHRDRDPWNNRWENLREATPSQNHMNRVAHRNNACGLKGVRRNPGSKKNPWRAQISEAGKAKHLGSFPTAEQAHAKYIEEATRLYGEFARGNT
jgi:hypothetical protein